MQLVKGSYVQCTNTTKVGVIARIDKLSNKFLYVRWLTNWDTHTQEIKHYLEFITLSSVIELPSDKVHGGLELLRSQILR